MNDALWRRELIERFNLSDYSDTATKCRPFDGMRRGKEKSRSRTPFDEVYRKGTEILLSSFGEKMPDLVFTGVGGDELTRTSDSRIRDSSALLDETVRIFGSRFECEPELPTPIPSSSLLSSFVRSDMFLENGIWPKSPFLDPAVVEFCSVLPDSIKRGRLLNILCLARLGVSDGFLFPRYRENFSNVFLDDLRSFDFEMFMENSIIFKKGIADISVFNIAHRQLLNNSEASIPLIWFYNAAKLESILTTHIYPAG